MIWECKMVQSLWKIVWWLLQKSKTRIIIGFSSPLFWHVCMPSPSVMSDCVQPHGLSLGSPGKNTGVACHFPLQGIFPTQGSNLHFLWLLPWQNFFFFFLLLGPSGRPHSSGSLSKRTKSRTSKRYLYIRVHCNIIHNSQEVEEIYVFLSRLIHKQNCHKCTMACYSAFRRREILTYHVI